MQGQTLFVFASRRAIRRGSLNGSSQKSPRRFSSFSGLTSLQHQAYSPNCPNICKGGLIMGAAENKALIQNMFAELGKGNGQAFLDNMTDDVRVTLIGTT